ncbi:MAG TPA: dolichol-phosphate mannosyltransferase [Gemmobacter sp.]|nr:dolichol-phosphate mannosyltransferase [Gemmobacter sp.]
MEHLSSDQLARATALPLGSGGPAVSIIVPLRDEAPNIRALVAAIHESLPGSHSYEIILVDDASRDDTRQIALALAAEARRGNLPDLRVIAHDRAGGQSAAVHSGVRAARGAVIATLDGDGQNPPSNLPALIGPLLAPGRDPQLALVAGQRVGRQDTLSKRLASRFANALRAAVLQDGTRDTGCGLKAFDRAAYLALPYFDHQHRFLPALFARDGWQIAHVDVTHAPRLAGRSKYTNLHRALVGLTDLAGMAWLIRRRKRARPVELSLPETI